MTDSPETRCDSCGELVLKAWGDDGGRVVLDRMPLGEGDGGWTIKVSEAPATYDHRHDAGSSAFGVRQAPIAELLAWPDPAGRYQLHDQTCSALRLF